MSITTELIKRAEELSEATDLSLQEAMGQVIGALIWEVDDTLLPALSLDESKGSDFHRGLNSMLDQWFK